MIHLDIQKFLSVNDSIQEMIKDINESILFELIEEYGDIKFIRKDILSRVLSQIFAYTNESFIFIIDEWDCIFREYKEDKEAQEKYLDYLRLLFKEQPYVELVYMTGILPIKKYGTHSALNMFDEISMVDSGLLSEIWALQKRKLKNFVVSIISAMMK